MKCCTVVLLFACGAVFSEAKPVDHDSLEDISYEDEELTSKEETCVEDLHLDRNAIIKLNNEAIVPDDDEDFNKFLECYWKKEEWINGEGDVDYQNIIFSLVHMSIEELKGEPDEVKTVVKKRITEAVDYCKNNPPPKGNTPGQTAVRVQNCLMAQAAEIIKALELFFEDDYELSSAEQECLDELKLSEDVFDDWDDEDAAKNGDLGKFLICSWQKDGYMDDNGEVHFDKIESDLKEYVADLFKGETSKNKKTLEKAVEDAVQHCKENYVKTESSGKNIITLENCIDDEFDIDPAKYNLYKIAGFSYL